MFLGLAVDAFYRPTLLEVTVAPVRIRAVPQSLGPMEHLPLAVHMTKVNNNWNRHHRLGLNTNFLETLFDQFKNPHYHTAAAMTLYYKNSRLLRSRASGNEVSCRRAVPGRGQLIM